MILTKFGRDGITADADEFFWPGRAGPCARSSDGLYHMHMMHCSSFFAASTVWVVKTVTRFFFFDS